MAMTKVSRRVLLGGMLCVAVTTGIDAADLWDHAVDLYRLYGEMVPGHVWIRFDQFNGRGRLLSSDLSEMEMGVGPSGKLEGRTVYAEKDGEDVTAERLDDTNSAAFFGGNDDSADTDSPFSGLQKSPFDPDEQQRVSVIDTGRVELVNGAAARVHLFDHSTGGENLTTGEVWLDEATGAPLRLTARIEPLPGFIDTFEVIQAFVVDAEGRWQMSSMEFVGEGNILFVRRRIESEFRFADYFLPPAEPLN